jgi:ComF family protein
MGYFGTPFFMAFSRYLTDLARLFYPHNCAGCGYELYDNRHLLCLKCLSGLPATGFEKSAGNYVDRLFAGRLPVEKAASWLFFGKQGITQTLIHQLKYRGNTELGVYLGRQMGAALNKAGWFNDIDFLIPLPLNRKKLNIRGYNQSAVICNGLREATGIPVEEVAVLRTLFTETQTRKNRLQRWNNVEHVFDLRDAGHLQGRHALLVDDVITTGATIDACGQVLLKVPGLKLSVLSLAVAAKI